MQDVLSEKKRIVDLINPVFDKMEVCEYCGTSFEKKKSLTHHQRTAEYCRKIQEKILSDQDKRFKSILAGFFNQLFRQIREKNNQIKDLRNELHSIKNPGVPLPVFPPDETILFCDMCNEPIQ